MDEEEEVSTVTAVVKWFNPHKRYGFVHIPERDQDAFMHASVLTMDEEDWPREDDEVVCTLEEDGRGLKVAQVLKLSRAETQPRTHGAVRWFDRRKGYGFIMTESGDDIFVHRSALGPVQEDEMNPGQFVTFRARDGKKGKAAVDVELDPDPPSDVVTQINARLADQDAGDADQPGEAAESGESDEHVEADETTEFGEPGEPDEIAESGEPGEPDEADEIAKSGGPGEPDEADEAAESGEPGEPDEADEIAESGEPGEPDVADETAESGEPDDTVKSGEPN